MSAYLPVDVFFFPSICPFIELFYPFFCFSYSFMIMTGVIWSPISQRQLRFLFGMATGFVWKYLENSYCTPHRVLNNLRLLTCVEMPCQFCSRSCWSKYQIVDRPETRADTSTYDMAARSLSFIGVVGELCPLLSTYISRRSRKVVRRVHRRVPYDAEPLARRRRQMEGCGQAVIVR